MQYWEAALVVPKDGDTHPAPTEDFHYVPDIMILMADAIKSSY